MTCPMIVDWVHTFFVINKTPQEEVSVIRELVFGGKGPPFSSSFVDDV